ncbi:hypothetical protein HMPREF0063_10215 [Aeromicrobium marinum DSM 15272]|uniref:Uncharacterized protein n=1 Tax=Aeromicrobium marinum DSM 15272 TaxID=585531 RepID=E2S858_9ACTN|nr:hypothetical protein [Aeromicrobium marinum]EFQ84363.1 hypothetical protein HMPREF0063_10215 [Aeromicrobium marinum DSM 15272]
MTSNAEFAARNGAADDGITRPIVGVGGPIGPRSGEPLFQTWWAPEERAWVTTAGGDYDDVVGEVMGRSAADSIATAVDRVSRSSQGHFADDNAPDAPTGTIDLLAGVPVMLRQQPPAGSWSATVGPWSSSGPSADEAVQRLAQQLSILDGSEYLNLGDFRDGGEPSTGSSPDGADDEAPE